MWAIADTKLQDMGRSLATSIRANILSLLSSACNSLFNLVFSLLPAKIRCAYIPTYYYFPVSPADLAVWSASLASTTTGSWRSELWQYRQPRQTYMPSSQGALIYIGLPVIPSRQVHRLSLMTYHGVVLLLAGYQADEEHILRQYRAIVDK